MDGFEKVEVEVGVLLLPNYSFMGEWRRIDVVGMVNDALREVAEKNNIGSLSLKDVWEELRQLAEGSNVTIIGFGGAMYPFMSSFVDIGNQPLTDVDFYVVFHNRRELGKRKSELAGSFPVATTFLIAHGGRMKYGGKDGIILLRELDLYEASEMKVEDGFLPSLLIQPLLVLGDVEAVDILLERVQEELKDWEGALSIVVSQSFFDAIRKNFHLEGEALTWEKEGEAREIMEKQSNIFQALLQNGLNKEEGCEIITRFYLSLLLGEDWENSLGELKGKVSKRKLREMGKLAGKIEEKKEKQLSIALKKRNVKVEEAKAFLEKVRRDKTSRRKLKEAIRTTVWATEKAKGTV